MYIPNCSASPTSAKMICGKTTSVLTYFTVWIDVALIGSLSCDTRKIDTPVFDILGRHSLLESRANRHVQKKQTNKQNNGHAKNTGFIVDFGSDSDSDLGSF